MRTQTVAAKKRVNPQRNKVEFLAEPEWIDRVTKVAERLGLSISAYIRMVVTQRMNADEAELPAPEEKKGGRK